MAVCVVRAKHVRQALLPRLPQGLTTPSPGFLLRAFPLPSFPTLASVSLPLSPPLHLSPSPSLCLGPPSSFPSQLLTLRFPSPLPVCRMTLLSLSRSLLLQPHRTPRRRSLTLSPSPGPAPPASFPVGNRPLSSPGELRRPTLGLCRACAVTFKLACEARGGV